MDSLKKQQSNELNKLLRHYKYKRANIAKALGVTINTVNLWFHRGRISAVMAIKAEEVTKGEFKKQDLRPDVKEWFIEE